MALDETRASCQVLLENAWNSYQKAGIDGLVQHEYSNHVGSPVCSAGDCFAPWTFCIVTADGGENATFVSGPLVRPGLTIGASMAANPNNTEVARLAVFELWDGIHDKATSGEYCCGPSRGFSYDGYFQQDDDKSTELTWEEQVVTSYDVVELELFDSSGLLCACAVSGYKDGEIPSSNPSAESVMAQLRGDPDSLLAEIRELVGGGSASSRTSGARLFGAMALAVTVIALLA